MDIFELKINIDVRKREEKKEKEIRQVNQAPGQTINCGCCSICLAFTSFAFICLHLPETVVISVTATALFYTFNLIFLAKLRALLCCKSINYICATPIVQAVYSFHTSITVQPKDQSFFSWRLLSWFICSHTQELWTLPLRPTVKLHRHAPAGRFLIKIFQKCALITSSR